MKNFIITQLVIYYMAEPRLNDKIMFAPNYLFGMWTPSRSITWALKGVLHFITVISWLLIMIVPMICIEIITRIRASLRDYNRNTNNEF